MPEISDSPILLRTHGWADYGLLDSGEGQKLERYGPYLVIRPEPQCGWAKKYPALWEKADAIFDPDGDDDEGKWRFRGRPDEHWVLGFEKAKFYGRFTAFRHLAFFPEQAANWQWQSELIRGADQPHILNLFGYTGVATLVAASQGARVTHVDASKKAIGWARENAALSGLEAAPIRWICEDARKYVAREVKRGTKYDGIILDPPKYGRGPDGQVWRLFEDMPALLADCAALLSDKALFLLLNAYAARISGPSLAHQMAQALGTERSGLIDYGELTLCEDTHPPKGMPQGVPLPREIGLSFFARWRMKP